jgi:hypothetical protein
MTKGVGGAFRWEPFGVACRETLRRCRTDREVRRFDAPLGTNQRRAKRRRRRERYDLRVAAKRNGARECAKGSVNTAEPITPTEGFGQKARASRGPGRHG